MTEFLYDVYVASSWRNEYQPLVVEDLRNAKFSVFDFRNPKGADKGGGFRWLDVAAGWEDWTTKEYLEALQHPLAIQHYALDMANLMASRCCVMVLPCGRSASLETGYAIGAGKPTAIYMPEQCEPELMQKMADFRSDSFIDIVSFLRGTTAGWARA